MNIGKVPVETLERLIINPIKNSNVKRQEIMHRPKIGEDCAAIYLGGEVYALSTDPITGATKNAGYICVHVNANDIAACGCEPIGIMLTVLLPTDSTEDDLREIMEGVYKAAGEINIEVMGGHTEVTQAVTQPVLSGTIIGKAINSRFIPSDGAVPGQDVIMTKWAALEGTSILAREFCGELTAQYGKLLTDNSVDLSRHLSVVAEGKIASAYNASAMHDITEGGVLGACYEVSRCSNVGMEIYYESIRILDETKIIAEHFSIDPLKLISSGSMLIISSDGSSLVQALNNEGISAAVIGRTTAEGCVLIKNSERIIINEPESDELYKVINKELSRN